MTVYRCAIVYQGHQCVAGQYRRSDGLQPEPGWVSIRVEDLKKLEIHPRSIPWQAVAGIEHDGGISIRAWDKFKESTITADRPPAPEPKAGVNLSGDLILRTYDDFSGKLVHEMRYSDVYVDWGAEESTDGLANILEHKEGIMRIPLTDIRQYYRDYGSIFTRINCRKKNGDWDKDTLSKDGKTPRLLVDVMEFLFSQLPGSPPIVSECDLRSEKFDSPQGIEGRGEPAVQHIDQLLERYALKAQMQPNGWYAVNLKSSNRIPRLTIATAPKKTQKIKPETEMKYERSTSTPTNRAPAVACVGPRRVQRGSFPCTAVLRDPTTGNWHTLGKICQLWGWSLSALRRSVFISGPRQYADVPPAPVSAAGVTIFSAQTLHDIRREALKMAYRQYLPDFMITEDGDVVDPDEEMVPFLPMLSETAWYKNELNAEQLRDFPRDKTSKGDIDKIVMFPPVVRANLVEERYFNNYDELEKELKGCISREANIVEMLGYFINGAEKKIKDSLSDLLASEKVSKDTLKESELAKYGISKDSILLDVGGDVKKAASTFGVVMSDDLRIAYTKESEAAKQVIISYTRLREQAQDRLAEHKEIAEKHQQLLAADREKFALNGRIHGRFNVGCGPTTKASVHDFATGLIESSVPLCVVDRPWFYNGDDVQVIGDGSVIVTYGYEIKGSDIGAFTNYLFFADDKGDPTANAEPAFGGCHRSSPIKAKVVPIESREYLSENGNPMNYNACWSEAKGKAAQMCSGPAVVPGWKMELHGLRKCVLDAGIMSVQHEWDGDVGLTHVAVNAPGARMPLMAPNARPPRQVGAAQLRETLQREG